MLAAKVREMFGVYLRNICKVTLLDIQTHKHSPTRDISVLLKKTHLVCTQQNHVICFEIKYHGPVLRAREGRGGRARDESARDERRRARNERGLAKDDMEGRGMKG